MNSALARLRRSLDFLYTASGVVAGIFLVAIGAVILLQVGFNLIDYVLDRTVGAPIGLLVPSYAEFAGFFLASSTFFALSYTLRAGAHIRVTLLIHNLPPKVRRWSEAGCYAFAAVLSAIFSYWAVAQVFESAEFGDVVPGIVRVPLWIPQTSVAAGAVILTIALIDGLVLLLAGKSSPSSEGDQELLAE
jgi:TRAP-type C4-dicarboxylate transport system permease small subunit